MCWAGVDYLTGGRGQMSEPIDCRILRRLGSAKSILDVGCGDGRLVAFLAYHTRRKVVGLDVSGQGFAKAYKTAARGHIAELVE
jgi:cyclopropane fatty-acyl-phospholipid synthase-like methyltransferase